MDSNHRRHCQQIYSLSPLATREFPHIKLRCQTRWSWWTDSNPRPADYKSAALPAELHQHLTSEPYYTRAFPQCQQESLSGYLKSDVGFFCFRVFEKGGCSKVLCGVFSFRAVRGKAVAVKFYVGFPIRSDLCRKRHRHLTEDADAFLLECSGNQLNNSSSFCWSVPSLAYGSASNCRKLCLMSFVSSLKPRMYESAM